MRPFPPAAPWRRHSVLLLLALVLGAALGGPTWAEPPAAERSDSGSGPHIEARLVADQATVRPGSILQLGVLLEMETDWHVYWKQAGDAGLPPKLTWRLPAGFRAGPLRWPVPKLHTVEGGLVAYLYDEEVLLSAAFQVPFDLPGETVTLALDVDWLVCEDDQGCIPGEARLALTLPVKRNGVTPSTDAERFAALPADLPTPPPNGAKMALSPDGVAFQVPGKGPWSDSQARFGVFWEEWGPVDPLLEPEITRDESGVTVRWPWAAGQKPPEALGAQLTVSTTSSNHAWDFRVGPESMEGETAEREREPAPPRNTPETDAAPESPDDLRWADRYVELAALAGEGSDGVPQRSLLGVLLLAFLGGLILNVMPCVLPVLSLKILGFVEQAGSDPVRTRRHGYAFAAGVLASFVAIAGLLLLLRGAGDQVGWGFQLQQPEVVAGLAFLMFAVGLSLAGVFEIGQGLTGLVGRAASAEAPKGYLGSVWTGVLATLIATPCTAPFMGPAVGYALTQPAVAALLVFAMLGVGMAAPYVLLAIFPRWLRFLPRPGPWMVTLKQVMAFPMFATVIWLVWVFGRQVGSDAVVRLLAGLLLFAVGAWLYGRFAAPGRAAAARWIAGGALAVAFAVGGTLLGLRAGDAATAGESASRVATAPEGWVPYDGRVIARARAAGQPVFLDFTADWCLTCKANEAAFLETDAVRGAFEKHGIIAMQADWTRRDERITKALAKLDRSSVPLYVIVPPDPDRPAVVLRTAITTGYVVEALDEVLGPTAN